MANPAAKTPLWPCLLLGGGLGAVLDVAVFHLVLQWHHLASGDPRLAPDLPANLRLDGWALAGAWAAAVAGLAGLVRHGSRRVLSPAIVASGAILGWAAFNLADLAVNHLILDLHTAHPSGDIVPELAVTAWSLAMVMAGLALRRRQRRMV